jgi:heme-degrading monooxygenase HmoA
VIAATPHTPYFAVIFTSLRTDGDNGYGDMADRMVELAAQQPGFLGVESAREGVGITVSYWQDLASIKAWKMNAEHLVAQQTGRSDWYTQYKTRIAKVERDYGFDIPSA